ncbi:DUF1622 domain-containing protein [Zeaxanthinibacter sp. PT1]|uniref:DUF1622 domain-containing protein n=1 Tax=Zeaxanthinibacter TaxID=561554 RepID=UPI00234AC997|nr:DUF1622 domain-containing protein [Zeaxanthinibacter sp. PT1]MDC6350904.1 DUF1622 domain-containing protein [Zeaxanthinibacter sp. PT1]
MEGLKNYIHYISLGVESIGILVIVLGILFYLFRFLIKLNSANRVNYASLRQSLGKSILLGLEILVAADIISTVVAEPSLRSVAILGLIVLIRTFLSWSLEVELEGRFPWQKKPGSEGKL